MKLSEIVAAYVATLPAGIVLGEEEITRNLKDATRFYCGYATLKNAPPEDADVDPHTAIDETADVSSEQDFDLTQSEYAIIKPLFLLYVEKENATHLEASRGMGVDVFGRSVSEINADIKEREQMMPRDAFSHAPFTV